MFDGRRASGPAPALRVPAAGSMPVLGIDPGLSRCGFGVVVAEAGHVRVLHAGVIRTDPDSPLPQRLARLQIEMEALLDHTSPGAVAVERILFQNNVRTAISVGQASGIVLAAAARRGLEVAEYSPNETKLAVAGDGRADKAAMQTMVARICRLAAPPDPPDVADALALAICHSWRDRSGIPAVAARRDRESGFERAVITALARKDGTR